MCAVISVLAGTGVSIHGLNSSIRCESHRHSPFALTDLCNYDGSPPFVRNVVNKAISLQDSNITLITWDQEFRPCNCRSTE